MSDVPSLSTQKDTIYPHLRDQPKMINEKWYFSQFYTILGLLLMKNG